MRWTQTLIPTLREVPKEAEAVSHQLLLRGGFIRKLVSGVYSFLPLGFRVLQRIERIVREEMNRAGAIELLLPALHPAELWKQSGRYETLGADKIAFKNRLNQEFVLGPTHEEVITELAAAYLKSYQLLPKTLYQIQTKFRDELRPRFGIIRTREFIMKDAYSFDADEKGLDRSYQQMYEAYQRIFKRFDLNIDIVAADPGMMGGSMSHEFMVRCPYGEDRIAACKACGYYASQDIAGRQLPPSKRSETAVKPLEAFDTPNLKTIAEISQAFKLSPAKLVKTILFFADEKPIAVCVRGDHDVHEGKVRKITGAKSLRLANAQEIENLTGSPLGFTGPVGLGNIRVMIDGDVATGSNFVAGANIRDKHYRNVEPSRDIKMNQVGDLRYVQEGDQCEKCGAQLELVTTMEVGHVFKLGRRYTDPFSAIYRSRDGKDQTIIMGCYGLGISRILAAIVEQHHDPKGMIWPNSVAPYDIHMITVNHQDEATVKTADKIYSELLTRNLNCIYDDRNEPAGVKFNDADLIGSPTQVIVSQRNLAKDQIEIKVRKTQKTELISITSAADTIAKIASPEQN